MSRELGSAVLPCPLQASLTVEVRREDGRPLSSPVQVKLAGRATQNAEADGNPARAVFTGPLAGAWSVEVSPSGDETGFVPKTPVRVQLEAGAAESALVLLQAVDDEVIHAALEFEETPLPEGDALPGDEQQEAEDSEIDSATLEGAES